VFGTLGFSELIIILAIVLIIFGAGKLPQIGEGLGKALKGFKKEVHEVPTPVEPEPTAGSPRATEAQPSETSHEAKAQATPGDSKPSVPYQPGPELTPGTTAALMAAAGPQSPQPRPQSPTGHGQPSDQTVQSRQPPTVEERLARPAPVARAPYPPVPPTAQAKPMPKRPSAIVNKDAVARVQAQQAALKAQKGQKDDGGISTQDMQGFGETLGDTLRSFRQAAADVRNAIDPEMRTIRAELDAAHKEVEQSIEAAKQMPAVDEEPKSS
jgi:TatA/E family protein of Tat protein translocase